MSLGIIWLLKMLIVHFTGDFILQPNSWATQKRGKRFLSWQLYAHVGVHLILMLLVLQGEYWRQCLLLALIHLLTDALKGYFPDRPRYFFIDQAIHILAILITGWLLFYPEMQSLISIPDNPDLLLYALGVIVLTMPASLVVGKITAQWGVMKGLKNAGMYIGIAERLIILIFILKDQYEAIGLLITAKSILRFNSTTNNSEEHKSEYLLVGTLVSILMAVVVGIGLRWGLGR